MFAGSPPNLNPMPKLTTQVCEVPLINDESCSLLHNYLGTSRHVYSTLDGQCAARGNNKVSLEFLTIIPNVSARNDNSGIRITNAMVLSNNPPYCTVGNISLKSVMNYPKLTSRKSGVRIASVISVLGTWR
jgi:hypothetical protein